MEKILEMEKKVDLLRPDCWQDKDKEENFDSSCSMEHAGMLKIKM